MKRSYKKIFSVLLLFVQLFVGPALTCIAETEPKSENDFNLMDEIESSGAFPSKGRTAMNDFLENDLNINVEEGLKPLTETINSTERKGDMPEVSVRFSIPNPKPGETITASADVLGITNINDAYYTWYIRRVQDKCDDDLNCEDLANQKVLAIREQAALYFDPLVFDQKMNGGNDNGIIDGDEWPADSDDDGVKTPVGGANMNDGAANFCYVHDPISGKQYEISDPGEASLGCPDGYVPRCMNEERLLQCPVVVPGVEGEIVETDESEKSDTSSSSGSTSSGKITGAGGARRTSLARCLDSGTQVTCNQDTGNLYCPTPDGDTEITYSYYSDIAINMPTPFCIKKDGESGLVWTDPNISGCPESLSEGTGCYGYPDDVLIPKGRCDIGETEDNSCSSEIHTFSNIDGNSKELFAEEERFYGLNPLTNKTTPIADSDGALIAGIGVREFTWKYQEGDEIGVIVEGSGNDATKHENATYQTVFALMSPGCKNNIFPTGNYGETIKDKNIIIDTAVTDFDACIVENNLYTKPGTSEYDALDVTVSSGGSSGGSNTQAAIPSGLGIEKTITATAGQTQGGSISQPSDLYYEWDVQCQGESIKNDEDFKDNITSKTKGTNLKNLTLITDFPNGKDEDGNENGSTNCFDENGQGEITITAKINEPRSGGGSNFGQSTTTLSVYDIEDNPLKVYKTEIVDETKYQATSAMLCDEGIDKTVCRVMDNEVIAIKAEEFTSGTDVEDGMISWLVDGREYTCDESISSDCSNESNTDTIIIPFTGSDGDFVSVTANMSNISNEKNQKQQVTRVFRITEPSVMITPQGNAVNRKVLGVYTGFLESEYLDESETDFEIEEGETAVFSAMLYPEFLNTNTDGITYEWYIDGELYDTEKTIYYVPDSDTSISVKVKRELSLDERLALEEGLGITQSQTIPETFNQTIQLNVKENTTVAKGVGGFFATAQHNAPEYILFLLKITFAICIMLFVPSLVLGMGRGQL